MHVTPGELRHAIRGTLNALKLCVSAFEMPLDPSEKLEFLADIESSAQKLAELMDQVAALPESSPESPAGAAAALRAGVEVR